MSDKEFNNAPSGHESNQPPAAEPAGWGAPQPNYSQAPPPPPGYAPPPAAEGLSDNTASALAYLTFIPAIIFLLVAPYNQKPIIKFHAIQELGMTVIFVGMHFFALIPFFGWLIYAAGWLILLVLWVLCILKASQGSVFKLPVVGDFAAQQSGYRF